MIRRKDIIIELENMGYNVENHTSIKNGVEMNGIRFMNDSGICPVVYTDEIIENSESLYEAVEKVLDTYNNADIMDFDKKKFLDIDFIMQNLYIGLQKTGTEDIVKSETDFEGIEKYLYIRIDGNASFKLTYRLLETLKIGDADIWKAAENNTFLKTVIVSMAEKLSELTGNEIEDAEGIPAQVLQRKDHKNIEYGDVCWKDAILKNIRKTTRHTMELLQYVKSGNVFRNLQSGITTISMK